MTAPDNHPDHRSGDSLEQRAQALYQEACQRIDPATASRLRTARREALGQTRHGHARRWLLPTGALTIVALAALMTWQPPPNSHLSMSPQAANPSAQDTAMDNELPPDAERADPDLYQNLDFYGWLAAHEGRSANR
jgi:hypothetical protein